MKIRKIALTLMAALALSAPGATVAQENNADTDAPRDPRLNWLKVCEPLESGDKACILRQIVLKDGQFIGSFVLRDDPGQENRLVAIAAVPLGVLLPYQLYWQIDNGQKVQVPYVLCDPSSCISQLTVNQSYVNALKAGGILRLIAKNRQGENLEVEINLAGFTAAYEDENAPTIEQFNNQQSGSNALEQMLQDRAEQLRQEMGVEGEATTAQ